LAAAGGRALLVPGVHQGRGHPAFSGGHGYIGEDGHIRDAIKYTDYKRFGSTSKIIYDGQELPTPDQKQQQQNQQQNPQTPQDHPPKPH